MPLESTLDDIVAKLNERDFPDEAAISNGIVLRVLGDLNWPVHEHRVVWPEYKTMNGRVDYALCDPPSKPVVFVEVKQQGMAEAHTAVKQALRYAFDEGVRFVVLTDGQTWSFFLPTERGSYEERRVFKLDLCALPSQESKDVLARYLEHGRVASGDALEVARNEHRDRSRRESALRMLPEAWANLVQRPDDTLVRLLADAVESQTKVRPVDTDVRGFLRSLKVSSEGGNLKKPSNPAKPIVSAGKRKQSKPTPRAIKCIGTVIINGNRHHYKNRRKAVEIVLTELQNANGRFFSELTKHPKIRGRKRVLVAKSAEEMYPDSPHLRQRVGRLPNGWLLCKDTLDSKVAMKIVDAAVEVSGAALAWDPSLTSE